MEDTSVAQTYNVVEIDLLPRGKGRERLLQAVLGRTVERFSGRDRADHFVSAGTHELLEGRNDTAGLSQTVVLGERHEEILGRLRHLPCSHNLVHRVYRNGCDSQTRAQTSCRSATYRRVQHC